MSTAGKIVITRTSNEKSFVSSIYDYILGLNVGGSTISCDTTVNAQYDDSSIEIPTFNFTITPNIVLQMVRPAKKLTSVQSFTFNVLVNSEQQATAAIQFASAAKAITDVDERGIFIGYFASVFNTFLWFGKYDVTSITGAGISVCSIADNSTYRYGAGATGSNLEGATYYRSGVSGVEYTIANLFSYAASAGYIDYITHMSFINSEQEQARSDEIVNCSEISQGRSVAIQGGDIFFSVGPHTLIKLG